MDLKIVPYLLKSANTIDSKALSGHIDDATKPKSHCVWIDALPGLSPTSSTPIITMYSELHSSTKPQRTYGHQ